MVREEEGDKVHTRKHKLYIGGNRLVAMAGPLFGFQGVTKRLNRD